MMQPIIFLDFDDVICLNDPFSGYDVFQPAALHPPYLWEKQFSPGCKRWQSSIPEL